MKTNEPRVWTQACGMIGLIALTACSGGDGSATDRGVSRDNGGAHLDHRLLDRSAESSSGELGLPDTSPTSPDASPDSAPGPADPIVYGSYEDPGNKVCAQVHPPATDPCHVHTLAWLADIYGVQVTRAPPAEVALSSAVYRLVEIAEREGPVAIEVWVVDAKSGKLAGTPVTFCYPVVTNAAGLAACSDNEVPVAVKAEGHADFTMTGSGYIGCGQRGPFAAWIDEPGVPSDKVFGLGMLVGTNHRHVNLLFQRVSVGKAPANATRCPLVEQP